MKSAQSLHETPDPGQEHKRFHLVLTTLHKLTLCHWLYNQTEQNQQPKPEMALQLL